MYRQVGKSSAKIERSPAEKNKQSISLEQDRNIRSSRPKATATPSTQTAISVRRRVGRDLSPLASYRPNYRDQHKLYHSYSTASPSWNPFHYTNKARTSDSLLYRGKFDIRPTPVRRKLSEEHKSASTSEVQQPPISTAISSHDNMAAGGLGSSASHKEHFIIHRCQLRSSEPLNVYVPIMNPTYEDQKNLIRKFEIGESNLCASEKVIMMVGATGSGKTTLINGLFNYIFDVKWKDSFRLKLIEENAPNQAESITKYISSYTIHHQQGFNVPYTLTVIDTPGFGDTKGITRDQEITKQIKTFFTTAGPSGIDRLDAVAFVAQSSLARLTPSQKYIFESILAIFGKDIASCIVLLLTFADGQKPQILDSFKEANFPYRKYYKFNSSALYINNNDNFKDDSDDDDDDATMGQLFWDIGEKSFKSFKAQLDKVHPTSLVQTNEVLDERLKLEISIEGIQKEIKLALGKLERLATEIQVLSSHEEDIDKNKDINYEVNHIKCIKRDTDHGQNTTNCLKCFVTCHERCAFKNDDEKIKCIAMTERYCTICPEKCFWNMHRNQPYVYVYEHEKKVNTLQGLKTRYQVAEGKKLAAEQVVKKCANEFEAAQVELLSLAEAARKSIQRLEEIALRPNPLSIVEYIDILINSEKQESKPFWQKRTTQLQDVRKKAVYLQEVRERKLDPFEEYRQKIDEEKREKRRGVWTRAAEYLERGFGVKF